MGFEFSQPAWFKRLCIPQNMQVFSAEELARAGDQAWPRLIDGYVLFQYVAIAAACFVLIPRGIAPLLILGGLLLLLGILVLSRRLWRDPAPKRVTRSIRTAGLIYGAGVLASTAWLDKAEAMAVIVVLAWLLFFCTSAWWGMLVFRQHQIKARLRELDERDQQAALQAQLLQAQIQPHFLFNSLASLGHWVRSQDPRAAPMLEALTAYLRATLPLFNREQLSVGEELAAVREYLTVMQARLGERLKVEIDVDPALLDQPLPPAILLTLVENAIEHGVVPKLGEATLRIEGRQLKSSVLISVADDGPGLPEHPAPQAPGRGVGLNNSRLRLAQRFGERARLSLENGPLGGCLAQLRVEAA
ncbi:histidine kinase [Pelomonas sp. SE-A7]|uniref:sensor histidine kinase n=1 Tax=Pelomonas sp. SE-A7 TaxID=3054953 RepID=UPI00259C860B|nr:histidine kinase [Pelomonas sp. SE-A7]MDM4766982.1 histidine kinase [Pelomonas sp. SE-A7]